MIRQLQKKDGCGEGQGSIIPGVFPLDHAPFEARLFAQNSYIKLKKDEQAKDSNLDLQIRSLAFYPLNHTLLSTPRKVTLLFEAKRTDWKGFEPLTLRVEFLCSNR